MSQETRRFKTPPNWNLDFTEQPFFSDLVQLLPFANYRDFPDIATLNKLIDPLYEYQFVDDALSQILNPERLYYEQFIHQKRQIPTRKNNWHDMFNAAIWVLFPKVKRFLNQIHIQEIDAFGLNPRTPVRNRVTHFDECGSVLLYEDPDHVEALQQHKWVDAFVEKRGFWNTSTRLIIFGHANYEMLLDPYIGLTGKYLPVRVEASFWKMPLVEQYQWLDGKLVQIMTEQGTFAKKGRLKPIPLLGIPGWWQDNDTIEFYQDQDYFRPLRAKKRI